MVATSFIKLFALMFTWMFTANNRQETVRDGFHDGERSRAQRTER